MRWALGLLLFAGILVPAAPRDAAAAGKLRVAVYEYADNSKGNTGTEGAAKLLEKAGADVKILDITRSPLDQDVDAIFFGAWLDRLRDWRAWVSKYKRDLQGFIASGGLLVEMAQSDDRWAVPRWLPEDFHVRRSDRDVNTVRLAAKKSHPLLGWMPLRKSKSVPGDYIDLKPTRPDSLSWEGFYPTEGVEVLLAEDPQLTRPQMVLGAYGKGRFLVTSLHLDKLYRKDGTLRQSKAYETASRAFFRRLVKYGDALRAGRAPKVTPSVQVPIGPVLGHIDARRACIWYRPSLPGAYELKLWPAAGGPPQTLTAESLTARDRTMVWQAGGLAPGTEYLYTIRGGGREHVVRAGFRTAPASGAKARVRLALGSCASTTDHPVWDRMISAGADAIVLLGDTPYIDTTRLSTARARHRQFLQVPALAAAIRQIPLWGTWDDHDFGKNNADGRLAGKAGPRQAFTEYRAQTRYGHDGRGIYTRVRHGPVEVFLLDTRWFSGTAPSPAAPTAPTCLGRSQWDWLLRGLRSSSAPFKVLACGMIWHAKGPKETDHWGTYKAERDALFAFIGKENIPGVVLVGGDIHVSQHLVHASKDTRAGYALHEMIVSPLHDHLIPALDKKHPAKVWSAHEKHVFLLLDADTKASLPALTASWIRADGKVLRKVRLRPKDLAPPETK